MVTARRSAVETVTGIARVQQSELTANDWWGIVCTAVENLSVKYLRQFKTIQEHLTAPPVLDIRNATPASNVESDRIEKEVGSKKNYAFLNCATIIQKPSLEEWPREKTTEYVPIWQRPFVPFTDARLLLGRNSRFYLLETMWEVKDTPIENSRYRGSFKRQFEATKIRLERANVPVLMGQYPESRIGHSILVRFMMAQTETANDLLGQYQHARKCQQKIEGYVSRLA